MSGILEITWYNGIKMLDSPNANYSYGTLQKVLTYGISQIELEHVKNTLILGMGGGSIIKVLREEFEYPHKITAIEIDPVIVDIAFAEFGVYSTANTTIICTDALSYTHTCTTVFDMIIIDLFIDTRVPVQFYDHDFWKAITHIISTGGYVIFNAGMLRNQHQNEIETIIKRFGTQFEFQKHENIQEVNTLLIGKKR